MPVSGSGLYQKLAASIAYAGSVVRSIPYNLQIDDLAAALNNAFGKISTKSDAAEITVTGTVNDIVLTAASLTVTAYPSAFIFTWASLGPNTAATKIRLNSLAQLDLLANGRALGIGETGPAGYICRAIYDGTAMVLLNPYEALGIIPRVWATLDNATETNVAATYAVVSNVITVTKTAHGQLVGHRVKYLPSSGGLSGQNLFLVLTAVTANTMTASLTAANTSGNGNISYVPLLHAVNCHSCCLTATGRIFINYSVTAPTLNQYMAPTAEDLSSDTTGYPTNSSSPPTTTGWSMVVRGSDGSYPLIVRFVILW